LGAIAATSFGFSAVVVAPTIAADRPALLVGAVPPLPYIESLVEISDFPLTLVSVAESVAACPPAVGVVCCLPVVGPLAEIDGPGVAVDSFAPPGVDLRELLLATCDPPAEFAPPPSSVKVALAGVLLLAIANPPFGGAAVD